MTVETIRKVRNASSWARTEQQCLEQRIKGARRQKLIDAIIWSEILGAPSSKKPYIRKEHQKLDRHEKNVLEPPFIS